ncbi:hypothetical protein [Candidatus Contubernalis alkaliaceticus]|uniref:hypothetical protein n=1 Tax=Candidatus Contubernalis alkaliaceticus TaxID=338645 RepID=UPI001F4BFEDA|nr:hypothetical protein [Candidatus Contubernalis alkalaceticus]UNC92610.1 hypothetical protein HUE98_11165 [Candidatus Contubernalis alkalaceticus]
MVEYNINFLFQLINIFILLAVIGVPIYILVKVVKSLADIQQSNQRIENILKEINEKLMGKE